MNRFAALIVVAGLWVPEVSLAESIIELRICHAPGATADEGWWRSSLSLTAQILRPESGSLELRVRRAVCNETMPDASCSGISGAMFCQQAALDRIQAAAAWLTVAWTKSGSGSYEEFRRMRPRAVAEAFQFADGVQAEPEVAEFVQQIRAYAEGTTEPVEAANLPVEIVAITAVQQRIAAFNLGALVGHESHHMNDERCPLSELSWVESTKVFDHVVEMQTSDRLFCPSFPDPNEMRADRCAARQIERLHAEITESSAELTSQEEFARRAAADMVAFQAIFGFRRFEELPAGKYQIVDLDQYFQPTFRLVLLAGAVAGNTANPMICGEAAGLFVHAVQEGFRACGGKGKVSDELLSLLPMGVELSWNGAPWTTESLSCYPE